MDNWPDTSFGAVIYPAVIFALTIPHIHHTFKQLLATDIERHSLTIGYEDEDGIATEKSEKATSDLLQRVILSITAIVAVLTALLSSLNVTGQNRTPRGLEQWLQFSAWVAVLFQGCVVVSRTSPQDRYKLGIWSAVSSLLLSIVAFFLDGLWSSLNKSGTSISLSAVKCTAGIILSLTNVSFSRRPEVYLGSKPVDRQRTVSFLSRYTFSWPAPILSKAAKNKQLEPEDLPAIGYEVRARILYDRWQSCRKQKLWRKFLQIYRTTWFAQLVMQLLSAAAHYLPQVLLFFTLRLLEERDARAENQKQIWIATVGLGGSLFISSWLDTLLQWIATMELELPIREQLSAVIFSKALRIKEVVSVKLHDSAESKSSSSECCDDDEEEDDDDDGDDDGPPKTKQSMTNLLGVDAVTIANFAKYSHTLLDCMIKFVLAIAFLTNLLGWIPVLWTCTIPVVLVPLNYYLAHGYSKAEDALMTASDRRMAVLSEMLQGIRQIKFTAQEDRWNDRVQTLRSNEIKKQGRVFNFHLVMIGVWTFGPLGMSLISLASYFMVNKTLSPSIAFTALSIFQGLSTTLSMFPETISDLMNAIVSARRIEQYLDLPEHDNCHKDGEGIAFLQSTISWPSNDIAEENATFKLHDMNLQFPRGELTVIAGPAGAGKSLLLLATIGEADLLQGQILFPQRHSQRAYDASINEWTIDTSIAFVPQNPWIENGTVRENILFGLPLNPERYRDVLRACCLQDDLDSMQDGDQTDLGANGVNLSGGQKWRVALARALYSHAGIIVLDDIFSAVDARVGRHLFEEALTGSLAKGRTRIVATHHTSLCWSEMKYYVLLENGRISFAGKPENYCLDLYPSGTDSIRHADSNGPVAQQIHLPVLSPDSRIASRQKPSEEDVKGKAFYEAETRAKGAVKLSIYGIYLKACGGYLYWIPIVITLCITLVADLAIPYWVSIWTRDLANTQPTTEANIESAMNGFAETSGQQLSSSSADKRFWTYLGVYIGLFFVTLLTENIRYQLVFRASIRGSLVIFEKFLLRILQAPLSFLDTTPVGQILNRFSADFSTLDSDLGVDLPNMLHGGMTLLSVIVAALFISPLMVCFGFTSLLLSWYIASLYVTAARDAKRIESNARSPMFEQFGSIVDGLVTIRAFDKVDQYMHRMYSTIDAHCQALWHLRIFNCWMMFRLNMVGALYVTVTAALIATIKGVDASVAGFALSFALQMSEVVDWVLSEYAELELDFNAVERIVEYTQLETEHQGGVHAPAGWPTKGEIEANDLVVGYGRDSPPALRGLSFLIKPNEHIGIVGRTGSGKSSLTLALLRFLEARSGSIHIDGMDISRLRLRDLRSRIAIIPQDPVIFSGTLRSVLDPSDQYADSELLAALTKVRLTRSTDDEQTSESEGIGEGYNNTTVSLSSPISERGKNLSQGQRQLVCLAQALLSRPKILIMDEATSSIDMRTDALIQQTIRQEFQDSTLMVIAHRLSTVADFDRILVMGEGEIAEFDTPAALLGNEGGTFWTLVDKSGERESLRRVILGGERQ
ncbi:putative ABC transporter [Aspergillus alliaceus]|uniref:putative ABC transporter n=1 Tax=Petromyces alliaceus TaxID=209559 RepID=UPI0012A5AEA9|nr:P-loop containing nucleoside triphosphate hydrolase protein [Aspergillus alliaceus]KAB8239478.1 P-loop containing nucleoside triphosphate hydrolase protein [Aspergillus alliaceus]